MRVHSLHFKVDLISSLKLEKNAKNDDFAIQSIVSLLKVGPSNMVAGPML